MFNLNNKKANSRLFDKCCFIYNINNNNNHKLNQQQQQQ